MATPEQLILARQKALQSPRIGKRGKGAKTIAQEERQSIFDEIVSEEFIRIIKLARPEYKLDRFLGKLPDKIEHSGEIKTGSVSAEILALAEAELKKRRTQNDL